MHANSLRAYDEEQESLGKRSLAVMRCVQGSMSPLTDRQIMRALGYSDPNTVRPRITELVKAGHLEECGSTVDPETGKHVRLVRLKSHEVCMVQEEMAL